MRITIRDYIHTYIHYITLHYITLHYITLHYITLHYITLHYITLHYITLHTYIPLHYITLHCITYITLHYITLHYITLHYITLHYIHYITLHYITLHYITSHVISLHYITYIHTYIHIYIYMYRLKIMFPTAKWPYWGQRQLHHYPHSRWNSRLPNRDRVKGAMSSTSPGIEGENWKEMGYPSESMGCSGASMILSEHVTTTERHSIHCFKA